MNYLFNEQGRCVMMVDGDCSEEFVRRNSAQAGIVHCVSSDYIGGMNEVYYHKGEAKRRVNSPVYRDGMWLRRMPVPAKVYINDTMYNTTDTDIELSFPYPNTYKIRVEAFPYLDANFEVTTT